MINKVTIHYLPAPSFILVCQLAVSAATAKLGDITGVMEVDKVEWSKVKKFIWVIVGFLGTIFCNIKVRHQGNTLFKSLQFNRGIAFVCSNRSRLDYCGCRHAIQVLQHSNVETFITFRSR